MPQRKFILLTPAHAQQQQIIWHQPSSHPQQPFPLLFRVLGPSGDILWHKPSVTLESHFNIGAKGPGAYRACFFNQAESYTDAYVDLVYFTLGHLRRPGASLQIPKGTSETRSKEVGALLQRAGAC